MTIDGFGTATVPAAMVLNELQNGELIQVNYQWAPKSLSFSARYDAEKSAQFVVRAAEIASEISLGFALEFAASNKIVSIS